MPGDICMWMQWRRACDSPQQRTQRVLKVPNAEPLLIPAVFFLPQLPWGFLCKCSYLEWYWDTEVYCLLSLLYYETMSGFRLNFLFQVTLCWEPWMCFSGSTVSSLPRGLLLTAHLVIYSRRAVTMRGKSLPLPCPHEFPRGWCARRHLLPIFIRHTAVWGSFPPPCSSSKISLTRKTTKSLLPTEW